MAIRSFTGYLNSALFGTENPSAGSTFDVSATASLEVLMSDGAGDDVVEGDSTASNTSTEQSEDAEGDQFVFIRDATGNVLADGREFYLELTFEFTVSGQTFTGYHFEDENGQDFTIVPPGVPVGTATINSIDFSPGVDEVRYDALSSGDENIDASFFTQLDLSGVDQIDAGDGDDVIVAGAGADTVEGGGGSDTISGGAGADTIYGDARFGINGQLDSGQAPGGFSLGSVDGWYSTGSGGSIERWGDGFLGTSTDDGSSFIELDVNSGGGVDHLQTDLELTTGVEYIITIDHAARSGSGVNDDFEVTQNDVVIATISPSSIGYFSTSSFSITGLTGTDTIGFREVAGQSNGVGVLLDNFSVSLSPTAVAADPSTFNDAIDAGAGNDTIYGQEGDDVITGGTGDDVISVGVGADTVVVTDGGGTDTVTDFDITEDTLDVSGLTNADGAPTTAFDVTVTSDGQGGSILTFENGEQVILRDVAPEDVDTAPELNAIGIPCFAKGTLIETVRGSRLVEDLQPGDRVRIGPRGASYATLRLNLSREVSTIEMIKNGKLKPVRISAGALGHGLPLRDLLVSRQHRMLVTSQITRRMFASDDVLVAAIRLVDLPGVQIDDTYRPVEYFHLVFDEHQIVVAEGAPSESFLLAPEGINALTDEAREELFTLFPMIATGEYQADSACFIPCGKRQRRLVSRHLKNGKKMLENIGQTARA